MNYKELLQIIVRYQAKSSKICLRKKYKNSTFFILNFLEYVSTIEYFLLRVSSLEIVCFMSKVSGIFMYNIIQVNISANIPLSQYKVILNNRISQAK